MTDLEHELRAMLADRGGAVVVDRAASEQRIANRLLAGDEAVVVAIPDRASPRRVRWLAGAAAAALLVGVAVVAARDDGGVQTGPAAPTPARLQLVELVPSSCEVTAPSGYTPVTREIDGTTTCELLGPPLASNVDIVDVRAAGAAGGGWQVSFRLTDQADARVDEAFQCRGIGLCAGTYLAVFVDGELRAQPPWDEGVELVVIGGIETQAEAEALAASLLAGAEPDPEPSTTTTSSEPDGPHVVESPAIGAPGASAKDVATQFARLVYGVEYVTTGAQDLDGVTEVTLEGEGNVLVATVAFDEGIGRYKLIELRHPLTKFLPSAAGNPYHVTTPTSGRLTITVYGGEPGVDLSTAAEVVDTRIDGPGTQHGPFDLGDLSFTPFWMRMDLVTDDGQVLRYFSTMGD
jgi:hypothetical protein